MIKPSRFSLASVFCLFSASSLFISCGGDDSSSAPTSSAPSASPTATSSPTVTPTSTSTSTPAPSADLLYFNNTPVGDNPTLVWSEEFEGESLDPDVWFMETGDGSQYGIPGWGNNELQWYLPENAAIENGVLVITAKEESRNGFAYTSARIHTRDRVAVRYGRIEARIRLPKGQGAWPAFWMLPQDDVYGTWAASGEIDILESVNLSDEDNTIHGTIHFGDRWPRNAFAGESYSPPNSVVNEFHVYAVEWDVEEIRWFVDDHMYAVQNVWSTASADFPAPFDQRFYILLNLAIGGKWPGAPDESTVFLLRFEIDYVRVYSDES